MPSAIPYYEPYQDKPPIVERVGACKPKYVCPMPGDGTVFFLFQSSTMLCAEVAAALTRQAIEDWARGVARKWLAECQPLDIGAAREEVDDVIGPILWAPDDKRTNAAAHALADLLEQDDG